MGDTTSHTVLGRIAAAGKEDRQARAMTLQKALRVTLAKVADTLMGLPCAVIGAVVQSVNGDDIESALDDSKLLMLLDGPRRCVGAVMLDQPVVGGLIQQQTIGTVLPDTGDVRAMTRTDAAICAPLIDMMFVRVAPILDGLNDRALIEGFQFGAKAEDARTLALSLDAPDYVSITLTLDIARGARQGEMTLIIPTVAAREVALHDPEDGPVEAKAPGPDLAKTVMGLNAELEMVVCRLNMPLSGVRALKVGQAVTLTPGSFPNVQITSRTGRILGRGIVGHVDGLRAVRPESPPAHATQPMRRKSDKPQVNAPEVEVLTSTGRRATVPREVDVSDDEVEAAMNALPPLDLPGGGADAGAGDKAPQKRSDASVAKNIDVDLPDLDDLPDLADLPDLPDLANLPDLDDLPDLSDIPMRSAG